MRNECEKPTNLPTTLAERDANRQDVEAHVKNLVEEIRQLGYGGLILLEEQNMEEQLGPHGMEVGAIQMMFGSEHNITRCFAHLLMSGAEEDLGACLAAYTSLMLATNSSFEDVEQVLDSPLSVVRFKMEHDHLLEILSGLIRTRTERKD